MAVTIEGVGGGSAGSSPALVLSQRIISTVLGGDQTLIAGIALQRILVYELFLAIGLGNADLIFKDGPTALTGNMEFLRRDKLILPFTSQPWFETSPGNGFIMQVTPARQIGGRVYFTQS